MTLACTSSSAGASGRGRLSRRLHRPVRRCRAPPPAATQRNAAGAQAGAGAAKQRPVRQSMLLHVLSRYPLSVCGFCTCPPQPTVPVPYVPSSRLALLCSLLSLQLPSCMRGAACVLVLLFLCMHPACVCHAARALVATSLPCCLFAFMKCYPHTHCCFCQLLALRHAATSRCTTTASACICVRLPPLE
jgi:hypothetical protein